ncbi:MAG TPA: hypothetical protein VK155_14075 [Bacteroidales bacterium]|nr:hypothetical protein [Bacteroidales bacterium]
MKKTAAIIIIALLAFNSAWAQFEKPVRSGVKKTTPPPPPASTNKSTVTDTPTTPVYSLTAVKVKIRTGADNKEYPSNVRVSLGVNGTGMEYAYFVQENLKNEMRSNSDTEFGLEKRGTNLKEITLDALQRAGFRLRINYLANFQLDAWKIEGVTVTIEFRDQNGNLHPGLGQKTITFGNANGFLNGYPGTTTMVCNTDGYFNPLSASIE